MGTLKRFAPFVVIAAGVLYTLCLQTLIPDEVFYSCDGGFKFLLTKQFADRGFHDMRLDLDLRSEPWVRQLWLDGYYPFVEPFTYRRGDRWYMQYQPFFSIMSAPFYRWFGFRGLYVIPLLLTWMMWLVFLSACRRCGVAREYAALGLALI